MESFQLAFNEHLVAHRFYLLERILREKGVAAFNNPSYDAVKMAIYCQSVPALEFLAEAKFSFVIPDVDNGKMPIFYALSNQECLKYFLSCQENSCQVFYQGKSPLMVALEEGYLPAALLLIDFSRDLDCFFAPFNSRPVARSLDFDPLILSKLLEGQIDLSEEDQYKLIVQSIENNLQDHLRSLFYYYPSAVNLISSGTPAFFTLLLLPSEENEEMLSLFADNGCHLSSSNDEGDTLLHLACRDPSLFGVVRYLCLSGESLQIKNNCFQTPLQVAEKFANLQAIEILRCHLPTSVTYLDIDDFVSSFLQLNLCQKGTILASN